MKLVLTLGMAFLTLTIYAQKTLEVLTDVNENWNTLEWQTQSTIAQDADHEEKIKVHLYETVRYLKSQNTSVLTPTQITNRANAINKLKAYALEGNFPQNEHAPYKTPIFIDNYNTHCAVGYLMQQSGAKKLAQTISTNENLAYVEDIMTNGVAEWAEKNGFTMDELALIQPTYPDPIGGISSRHLITDKPILKMASYGSDIFLLLQDTTFSNSGTVSKANYIVKYYGNRGYGSSVDFPKTSTKPIDMATLNNRIYVATATEVYSADLSKNTPELTWINEGLLGNIKQIFSNDLGIVIDCEGFCYTKNSYSSNDFQKVLYNGLTTFCGFVSIGNLSELVATSIDDTEIYFNSYYEYDSSWYRHEGSEINYRLKGITYHNESNLGFSAPFRGNTPLQISNLQIRGNGSLHMPSINFFDIANQQPDWRINDIVSTGDKLFVIGRFDKSLSITNLPGRSIIELTNSGSSTYYPLPVTSMFEEVYSAVSAGNRLYLYTDLGLYSIKLRLGASVPSLAKEDISIYPNPVQANETLTIDLKDIKSINLTDNLGRLVMESKSNKVTIPNDVRPGIYQCTISTQGGQTYNERVIITQ
jgi:hypothetical protein